jgi:chromosome segregation ATPase
METATLQQQIDALDTRAQTIQAERARAQQEHDQARATLSQASEPKALGKASESVALARMRCEALGEALSDVQADTDTLQAQAAAIEEAARLDAYAQELAGIAAEAEAQVCQFERERELVCAALAAGLARLGQIRDEQKATRARFIEQVKRGFPELGQLRPSSGTEAERQALDARAGQLRKMLSDKGASLAPLRAWEPSPPSFYEGLGDRVPTYSAPGVELGGDVDTLLAQAREASR